jgi:hypothetical protein
MKRSRIIRERYCAALFIRDTVSYDKHDLADI